MNSGLFSTKQFVFAVQWDGTSDTFLKICTSPFFHSCDIERDGNRLYFKFEDSVRIAYKDEWITIKGDYFKIVSNKYFKEKYTPEGIQL